MLNKYIFNRLWITAAHIHCSKSTNLFSASIARQLVNLITERQPLWVLLQQHMTEMAMVITETLKHAY